jgi:hypothetical protein
MLSRGFLLLAGIFTGLWLRDPNGTLYDVGFPALALVSLLVAFATTPPSIDRDVRNRVADAFGQWLDAWYRLRTASESERPAVEDALRIATQRITIDASEVVLRSLRRAAEQELSTAAVAQLTLDVRRNLRSGGVTLRASDVESLVAREPTPTATVRVANVRRSTSASASPASFLS